ncbi:hypothetical protein L2089_13355 [Paenibacillus hunanensis]|uniref:hypothetical protein n=1 Tax=Paenibacillus hunanensis TaxID=539262 RepID=UPI0020264793|nr:hypothetical protein [Paenibacillus hunanensis]MCL9661681.1 hypothetical protein [Paenibacillus hunanensis]
MTNLRSVRYELKTELVRQGYTLSSFSKISGVNRGVLSSTLSDPPTKSLSMNQLNQMSEALHLPVGWLYKQYAEELIKDIEHVSWRKVKDLLTHCLILNKVSLIKMMLDALKDKTAYVNYIFELAEEVIEQGSQADLQMFYQYVLDYESNPHTERFAVSQYRLFRANLGLDLQQNFKAMIQFAPYRHTLPLYLKLDALAQLIHVSYALKDWEVLNEYGKELVNTANLAYKEKSKQSHISTKKHERPLIVYFGKGYTAQFIKWEHSGNYEEAKKLIPYYEDLSWVTKVDPLDTESRISVEKHAIYAKCNRYNLELLQGNYSALKPYVDYLEFFPEEHPASLTIIIKASNMHKWDIDEILEKYHHIIYPSNILDYLQRITSYSMIVEINRYINIYYELALYYFERKKNKDDLEHILSVLKSNIEKYNRLYSFDSTQLFEKISKFYLA